jgi:hypothetical protein
MGNGGEILSVDWKVLPYRDLPGGGAPCELADEVDPVSWRGIPPSIVARRSSAV